MEAITKWELGADPEDWGFRPAGDAKINRVFNMGKIGGLWGRTKDKLTLIRK